MKHILFDKPLRQSEAYKLLKKDITSMLSHAYLVVSPDEMVMQSFMTILACAIFCQEKTACMDCPECQKVLHYNHPNVRWLNLAKETIKVDDIKELTQNVYIKAHDDGPKVYFVLSADKMNIQAQNKLLKTLEEPPPSVSIFLGATNEFALNDTIRSRCRLIRIEVFNFDTIYNEIFKITQNKEVSAVAAACSEGLLGKAYRIARNPDFSKAYLNALTMLRDMKRSSDVARFVSKDNLPKDANEHLDILSVLLRDLLANKLESSLVLSKHLDLEIEEIAPSFSKKAIIATLENIVKAREKLFFYINSAVVLEELYFSMLEAKYKWRVS